MRIVNNLMILFLFFYSSIFFQTSFSEYVQPVSEMKSYQSSFYNRYNLIQPDKISAQHHSFFNLSGQALVGSTLAIGFSILPLSATFGSAFGSGSSASTQLLSVLALSS